MRKKLVAFACLTLPLSTQAALVGDQIDACSTTTNNISSYSQCLGTDTLAQVFNGPATIDASATEYSGGPNTIGVTVAADFSEGALEVNIDTDQFGFQFGKLSMFFINIDGNNNDEIVSSFSLSSIGATGSNAFGPSTFNVLSTSFDDNSLSVIFDGHIKAGGSGQAIFDLGLTVAPIPIPAAAWLFGSALLGMGLVKRKNA